MCFCEQEPELSTKALVDVFEDLIVQGSCFNSGDDQFALDRGESCVEEGGWFSFPLFGNSLERGFSPFRSCSSVGGLGGVLLGLGSGVVVDQERRPLVIVVVVIDVVGGVGVGVGVVVARGVLRLGLGVDLAMEGGDRRFEVGNLIGQENHGGHDLVWFSFAGFRDTADTVNTNSNAFVSTLDVLDQFLVGLPALIGVGEELVGGVEGPHGVIE